MLRKISFAFALVLAALVPASASALTVTFDDVGIVHGTVLSGAAPVPGISSITVTNSGGGPNLGVAFDSEQASDPNDGDLLRTGTGPNQNAGSWAGGNLAPSTVLNNLLIIQENSTGCGDGTCDNPDDEGSRPAGEIEIIFAASVLSFGLDVVDIEDQSQEKAGGVRFFDGVSDVFRSWVDLGITFGNNHANRIAPVTAASLGLSQFDKVIIEMGGSGGIDNLVLPEPGVLALLGLGLAGLLALRRR